MNYNRTEADQVVDDATQNAARGAGAINQVFENAARSGEGQYLIYGLALVFVIMGVIVTFFDYLKSSETKAQTERIAAQGKIAQTMEAKRVLQAEQAKKLIALSGGIPATKSTKTSRALPGLRGTWDGVQSCRFLGALKETGIRLLLKANAAGHIDGVLIFYPILDKSSDVPYGSYRVSGEITGMDVNLHAGSWLSRPSEYKASDLHFSLHKAPISALNGVINLKDYGNSSVFSAASIRAMLSSEKIENACGSVRLYDNVESIDWHNGTEPAAGKKVPVAGVTGGLTDKIEAPQVHTAASPNASTPQPIQFAPSGTAKAENSLETKKAVLMASFRLTKRSVIVAADLSGACRSEFGDSFKVADWNDVRAQYQAGVPPDNILNAGAAWVSKDGEMYFRDRHYLVTRANHKRAPGYLAHDSIDNAMFDLGSWTTPNPVLCLKAT